MKAARKQEQGFHPFLIGSLETQKRVHEGIREGISLAHHSATFNQGGLPRRGEKLIVAVTLN